MKKFTNLGNNNKTTETSDNRNDFINNLIKESLSVENDKIIGIDTLSIAINKILDLNESKTTIKVLESIKVLSTRNLNLQVINESIEFEKKKMNDIKDEPVKETPKVELMNESVKHEDTKCKDDKCKEEECEECDSTKKPEGEEEDDSIKKKNEKPEETEVVESRGNKVYITDSEATSEIDDLVKMYESIKSIEEEEKKKLE